MDLSIIIPAFDEADKIACDIILASKFLRDNEISGEVIVVDDGSKDNTFNIAREISDELQLDVMVLKNDTNLGKGSAVKKGILASEGEYVLYADAGNTVPFNYSLIGIELIKTKQCKIANGSRKLKDSKIRKEQDWDRKLISKVFFKLFRFLFNFPKELTDTQCGFKVYNGETARELYAQLKTKGFLFEIEIILLALKNDYELLEFPVQWKCDRDSRLSILNSSIPIIKDLSKIIRIYK